jgi:hypothetical protein
LTDRLGRTWHALHLADGSGGRYAAAVPGGQLRSGGSVSLHGMAEDSAGNAIDQTILGIFAVR